MRKFKEVVRLHSLGLTQRQIARSCSIAQSTVHEYLKAARGAGVNWPLPAAWNEQELEGALSRKPRPGAKTRQAAQPDFPSIRGQVQIMKLHGMAQAFREQYESADASQLSFEERFGLLVDCQ
jgi:hypothetical protein